MSPAKQKVAPVPPPEEAPEPVPPALVPEPAVPVERDYKVVGPNVVHDTEPGSTFKATLPFDIEAALIEGGHIVRVNSKEN